MATVRTSQVTTDRLGVVWICSSLNYALERVTNLCYYYSYLRHRVWCILRKECVPEVVVNVQQMFSTGFISSIMSKILRTAISALKYCNIIAAHINHERRGSDRLLTCVMCHLYRLIAGYRDELSSRWLSHIVCQKQRPNGWPKLKKKVY
jgi:hypothetical protein